MHDVAQGVLAPVVAEFLAGVTLRGDSVPVGQ
jgi:hypothetical protein